ncbi:hypothetical protein N5D77_01865 [Comamonas thiooxydans]|uniref:Uncharacterized protein n=1 Tax=Comamonas thiooxydans TaxID=363952 RepID=A0AA42TSM8_9BURK|nr:hypothetical protein [Comamonas thiooxydans]MDH1332884.1 hypothetical protein [Comamonas thiooxydans]MDH1475090.1 hypothetical protein [Comamonas thiooxydans]MDH1741416.1 hypothetical protein [Comamonas thiooxydans]MDH1785311.1 hypothetical protein [Comamonas thiooxydans]
MENIPEFSVRCTLNGQTPGIAKPGVINAGKFSQLPPGAAIGVLLLTSWELRATEFAFVLGQTPQAPQITSFQ